MKKTWAILATIMLAGCMGGRSPEPSFYTFGSGMNCTMDDGTCITHQTSHMTVDVSRVRVAEYIDRPQMVTRNGVNVFVSQDNRWAEGLGGMIQRRLISELSTRLPSASIKDANFAGPAGDYSVFVEINQMDGTLGGMGRLSAVYTIGKNGELARPRVVNYTAHMGDTYGEYAGMMGNLMDKLAGDIARDLAAQN